MPENLEARLRALEDREAIRELRATYCFLVDDGRFDELVDDWFTADALCEFRAVDGSFEPMRAQGSHGWQSVAIHDSAHHSCARCAMRITPTCVPRRRRRWRSWSTSPR